MLRVHRDQDLVAVERARRHAILDMREDRAAHREIRRRFEFQQPRQDAAEAAGVEQEARLDAIFLTLGRTRSNARSRALNIHGNYLVAVTDLRAGLLRCVRKHMIEVGALHLIRGSPAGRELVAEIEGGVPAAARKSGAVLVLESGFDDIAQHACGFDVFHALWQQTFADREARKLLAFQDRHFATLFAQQSRGDRTGRPGADDQNLGVFNVHVRQPFYSM